MKKIICLGNNNYKNWLGEDLIKEIEESTGLMIFTGGADVNPMLYKEPNTYSYIDPGRTEKDMIAYYEAIEKNIPILGICFGSQMITAMQPNGKVVQNIIGHAGINTHSIITDNKEIYEVTSTHHQMMYPFNVPNHKIIAICQERLSTKYKNGFGEYFLAD